MLFDMILLGGIVSWVIGIMGVLAFVVFIERSLNLHRARIGTEDFLKGVFNILDRRNVREALTICDDTPGPAAHVVRTAIEHRDDRLPLLQQALSEAEDGEISRMERRLVVIASVAQIAPLLGLLGTVLAIIDVAYAINIQAPLVQAADLMPGVLRALISTAVGLTVAIPCYAAFNLLVIKIDRIVLDMQRARRDMLGYLSRWKEDLDHE